MHLVLFIGCWTETQIAGGPPSKCVEPSSTASVALLTGIGLFSPISSVISLRCFSGRYLCLQVTLNLFPNKNSERPSDLPKITQLIREEPKIQPQLEAHCLPYPLPSPVWGLWKWTTIEPQ